MPRVSTDPTSCWLRSMVQSLVLNEKKNMTNVKRGDIQARFLAICIEIRLGYQLR
jgi:hypothetical protein